MLTGQYRSADAFAEGDIRRTIPRFNAENMPANLAIVDKFQALADKKGCTPAQLAIAWVMAQGAIPIPGTRVSERLEENFGARDVDLTEAELKDLRQLIDKASPSGDRYAPIHMAMCGK
jgi:aryl-alcohol dehydrogenase-like predicted oxidoreductase